MSVEGYKSDAGYNLPVTKLLLFQHLWRNQLRQWLEERRLCVCLLASLLQCLELGFGVIKYREAMLWRDVGPR